MPSPVPSIYNHLKFRHHIAKKGFPSSSLQLVYCSNSQVHRPGTKFNFVGKDGRPFGILFFLFLPMTLYPRKKKVPLEKKILRWQCGDVWEDDAIGVTTGIILLWASVADAFFFVFWLMPPCRFRWRSVQNLDLVSNFVRFFWNQNLWSCVWIEAASSTATRALCSLELTIKLLLARTRELLTDWVSALLLPPLSLLLDPPPTLVTIRATKTSPQSGQKFVGQLRCRSLRRFRQHQIHTWYLRHDDEFASSRGGERSPRVVIIGCITVSVTGTIAINGKRR